jgi:hypothetical protein
VVNILGKQRQFAVMARATGFIFTKLLLASRFSRDTTTLMPPNDWYQKLPVILPISKQKDPKF